MFELVFVNPAKSLSSTVFVEGYPVEVPVSLPADVVSYRWEEDNLIFTIEHPDKESEKAWKHTLKYLEKLLEPKLSSEADRFQQELLRQEQAR